MAFQDHFSRQSAGYAQFRPTYPDALFDALVALAPRRALAWDVGTGNGQAALALAARMQAVIATDPSAEQLGNAARAPNVAYHVAPAEDVPMIADASVDLVTVAQALHWFDLRRFYAEVRRVARPGGVIAAWGYETQTVAESVDPILAHFYEVTVGPFWPAERRHIENRYDTLPFPFEPITLASPFEISRDLTMEELTGYLRTWSATQRYIAAHGVDPVLALEAELAPLWPGGPAARARVRWPIFIRTGRI